MRQEQPPLDAYEDLTPSAMYFWDDDLELSHDTNLADFGYVIDKAIAAGKTTVRRLPCGLLEETSPLHVSYESPCAVDKFRQFCVALGDKLDDAEKKHAIDPNLITVGPLPKPEQSNPRFPGILSDNKNHHVENAKTK